ncbi:hypothetical protein [Effusibacillus consociatus]|uniref:UTRA domain-containing protein n=1 Tax=Effusibacillus consociatus TaxID=1117041 RepID=A0ABV9Q395_9BACL
MKWDEIRDLYPDQYVKLEILASHIEGNMKVVDEVALIRSIEDPREATRELLKSKDDTIVYHTSYIQKTPNPQITIELRALRGLRGVVQNGH